MEGSRMFGSTPSFLPEITDLYGPKQPRLHQNVHKITIFKVILVRFL